MATASPEDQEITKDQLDRAKEHKRWVEEIRYYENRADKWESKADKIIKRYKDERSARDQRTPRFNILWSNIETLKPALYARTPKPDIERRFRDKDDLGRYSSMVLERAIGYFVNETFDDAVKEAVIDRLLPGRGTAWVRYEPHFKDVAYGENEQTAFEGLEVTDDVEPTLGSGGSSQVGGTGRKDDADETSDDATDTVEVIDGEDVCFDYVHFKDFGHTWGRVWAEVGAVWRKVYLTREELVARFGEEIGNEIQLDYVPPEEKNTEKTDIEKKATIYEIWNKPDREAIWLHKDYKTGVLDKQDDPLEIEGFFPCPRPIFATLSNDGCLPVPDYQQYQDQANELDELTSRIGSITKAVKVAGVYDASAPGIERLLAEGVENQLIPVDAFAALKEKGGIAGVYELLPMDMILKTLLGLYEARDKVKQDLYEITGIADIIRGASTANDTATAQQIKSQFGTLRLTSSQDDVQRFVRDLVRIGSQIIAKHFTIDTIKKISGVELLTTQEKTLLQMQQRPQQPPPAMPGMAPAPPPPPPPLPPELARKDPEDLAELMLNPTWEEVEALLRDDLMLGYRIDIETDSTLKFDQDAERDARLQFLKALGDFLTPAMQAPPEIQPFLAKALMFLINGFKVGKELESAAEVMIDKLEKQAQNPQPKPNPEMAKVQAQAQLQQQQAKDDMQLKQMQIQADQAKAQADAQAEIQRLAMQAKVDTNQSNLDAQLAREKAQLDSDRELQIAKMDNETKVLVAQISAKAQLDAATLQANSQAYLKTLDQSPPNQGEQP